MWGLPLLSPKPGRLEVSPVCKAQVNAHPLQEAVPSDHFLPGQPRHTGQALGGSSALSFIQPPYIPST